MILNYSKTEKNYFIMRLFNIYGDTADKFSFIENVINSKRNKGQINLINNGNAIRDFIHVNDVAKIYKIFIEKNK